MMKGLRKYALLAGVAAMTFTGLVGCGKTVDGTETVAVCNDENISLGVANLYARYQQAQMYSFYTGYFGMTEIFDTVADEETGATYGATMKDDLMDSIKSLYVLKQHADDFDVTISEETKAAIDEAAKTFMEENDAEALKKMGVSESDVATLLELYTYQTWMYNAMIADVDQEVSDEEAAQSKISYVRISLAGTETDDDGNTIDLTDEEKEEKQSQAEAILEALQASEDTASADLDAIAKEADENLSASTMTFGNTDDDTADSAIKEAVADLEDGQAVDHVVTSTDGNSIYVIRLDAALDRDATDSKKESIISQREQEDYQTELEGWMEEASFEVKEDVWDQIKITDTEVYTIKAEDTSEDETSGETTDETADDGADAAEE